MCADVTLRNPLATARYSNPNSHNTTISDKYFEHSQRKSFSLDSGPTTITWRYKDTPYISIGYTNYTFVPTGSPGSDREDLYLCVASNFR